MNELLQVVQFAAGVGLLVGGAYLLVEGGTRVAAVLGVKPVVVGLTVVAFGTSAPEFFVSAIGALRGNTELVLGNVIGSNVANIGLILALAAILRPVVVEKGLPRREVPLLVVATLVFTLMAADRSLSTWDGAVLTAAFAGFMTWTIRSGNRGEVAVVSPPADLLVVDREHRSREGFQGSVQVLLGMAGLAGGGHFIVASATSIALALGISEAVIGLTLVAVGTSLPELATTIMAAWKNQDDMALGNIIGSNLFNMLGVAGPIALFGLDSREEILPQLLAMCLLTVVVTLMIWPRHGSIGRWQGGLLLLLYAVTLYLWLT
jgi:cation:H+ antiporter